MAAGIQAATPGQLAGDGAEAIGVGTLAAGSVAVVTGRETVAPSAGSGAQEAQPRSIAHVSFSVEAGGIGARTFVLTQVGTPTLATTVATTPDGFDIIPTAQPAANTLYSWTYTSS